MQAKVTRIVGYGTPALRKAIESGMVTGEVKQRCEAVVRENERLKKVIKGRNEKIRSMQREMEKLQADAQEMRAVRMNVYRGMVEGRYGVLRERRRWGDLPQVLAGVALGAVAVAAIALIAV